MHPHPGAVCAQEWAGDGRISAVRGERGRAYHEASRTHCTSTVYLHNINGVQTKRRQLRLGTGAVGHNSVLAAAGVAGQSAHGGRGLHIVGSISLVCSMSLVQTGAGTLQRNGLARECWTIVQQSHMSNDRGCQTVSGRRRRQR